MAMYSQQFMRAINFALGMEGFGTLSVDPKDNGNWTGGVAGKGALVGTKWGISAAAFPQLDIPNLSREQAVALYYRNYYCAIRGDELPPRLVICVLDAAINQGVETAAKMLQAAVGAEVDGAVGLQTVSAVRSREQDDTIVAFLAERALRYAQSKQLATYGKGWMRRVMSACMEASR